MYNSRPTSLMLSMPQCLHIHSRPIVLKFFTGQASLQLMDGFNIINITSLSALMQWNMQNMGAVTPWRKFLWCLFVTAVRPNFFIGRVHMPNLFIHTATCVYSHCITQLMGWRAWLTQICNLVGRAWTLCYWLIWFDENSKPNVQPLSLHSL